MQDLDAEELFLDLRALDEAFLERHAEARKVERERAEREAKRKEKLHARVRR